MPLDVEEAFLAAYEADWGQVQGRHDGGAPPVTHPDFGNYATLRCGIDYERQRIGWLEWIGQQFAALMEAALGDDEIRRRNNWKPLLQSVPGFLYFLRPVIRQGQFIRKKS